MKQKVFYSGYRALSEGAIYSGCRHYYGITEPLNSSITNYMARRMPEVNGVFKQVTNNKSVVGMMIGSAACGSRVLTTSITDSISNMEQGFSYLSGMELPCVIGHIMFGRFGLKSIELNQAAYSQVVNGVKGNHKFIVLSPSSIQEVYDLTIKSFELADKYRTPVMLLLESSLIEMQEKLEVYDYLLTPDLLPEKQWAFDLDKNSPRKVFKIFTPDNDKRYKNLLLKFKKMDIEEYSEEFMIEDAEEIIIAFGLIAKVAKSYIISSRISGKKIGLFRPISLVPFPKKKLREIASKVKKITVFEINTGAMYDDVKKYLDGIDVELDFFGESEERIGFRNIISDFKNVVSS